MSPDEIKMGIVGLGDVAGEHAPLILANPRFRLVGGADIHPQPREKFSAQYDVPTFETLEDLLAGGVDVVAVCVPNLYHAPLTKTVVAHGALALCEKPPARNAREAHEMAEAAAASLPKLRRRFPKATTNLLYGLVYRHTMLNELPFVSREELGQVQVAFAAWERARGVPARGLFTNLDASGGGAGIDLGVHVLDLAWWLLGCPDPLWVGGLTSGELARRTKVHGAGRYDVSQFEVEDTAAAAVMFPGTMLFLSSAFAGNIPGGLAERVSVAMRGTHSGIELSPHTSGREPRDLLPRIATERYGVLQDVTNTMPLPLTVYDGYARQVDHVADVLHGAEPIVTPNQGTKLMQMIDALYASARSGQPVLLGS